MTEFWEANFIEKQEMWGFEPSHSALMAMDFFIENGVKNVLIPGIGYGRNAQVFREMGMAVTGIEISKTAIELANKHFGTDMMIYHGSVVDMPFDNIQYDGIFCYALIHLLDNTEREKLIQDCYKQLSVNGCMAFIVVRKQAPFYRQGKFVSKDRYEIYEGVSMFFYDTASIKTEFNQAGLLEIIEVEENLPFYFIKCKKAKMT